MKNAPLKNKKESKCDVSECSKMTKDECAAMCLEKVVATKKLQNVCQIMTRRVIGKGLLIKNAVLKTSKFKFLHLKILNNLVK